MGNDRPGESRFLYLDDVRVAYNQGWVTDGTVLSSLGRGNYVATSLLGNPDLKWEKRHGSRTTVSTSIF